VKIRHRAVAAAAAVAVGAAMCLAFAGAAGASPARSLARGTAVSARVAGRGAHSPSVRSATTTFGICDDNDTHLLCWNSNGANNELSLTLDSGNAYAFVYPSTANINGKTETTYEIKLYGSGVPGLCVYPKSGSDTKEVTCEENPASDSNAQEFWYTTSHALYSVGVSNAEGHDWCELDNIKGNDVQNAPCTSPASQPYYMTFPGL
jgi:hypothetical protein